MTDETRSLSDVRIDDRGWGRYLDIPLACPRNRERYTHELENRLNHPAPAAQFVVVLAGVFSVTTTDGQTRQFSPGDVVRVEDTAPCKGHITVVGDKPGYLMFAR